MVKGEVECLRVASRQHGVVTRAQALSHGLTNQQLGRRVQQKVWFREFPGVYRLEGAPQTWWQRLKASSLWADSGYVLSHRFTDYVHADVVELTSTRNLRCEGATVHHTRLLEPRDVASVECFRVASMGRTLLDLAATEPTDLAQKALDETMRCRWTNCERLEQLVKRNEGHPGVPLLRARLHSYVGGDGPTESELETKVLALITAAGLPAPKKQHVIRAGRRLRRVDFRFAGTPVVIEADGYAWHASLAAFEHDRERRNALTLRGFQVLQWTWRAIEERPHELIAELYALLNITR